MSPINDKFNLSHYNPGNCTHVLGNFDKEMAIYPMEICQFKRIAGTGLKEAFVPSATESVSALRKLYFHFLSH